MKGSFDRALLVVVLDVASFGAAPEARARALFASGADWIQLRDRDVDDDELYAVACALVAARDQTAPERGPRRVLLNKRVDIALASGADGVHLGFDAMGVTEARSLLGADALVGASCHSLAEVERSARAGALDYAHLAPIWNPNSKPATRPPLGPGHLREAAAHSLPILAQGGIDASRVGEVIAAGATGIAVTGALAREADPEQVLPTLRSNLDRAAQTSGITPESDLQPSVG